MNEIVLWGLPKGEADRLHERVMLCGQYTQAQIDKVKRVASEQGWHSFRVTTIDGSVPDFAKCLNV